MSDNAPDFDYDDRPALPDLPMFASNPVILGDEDDEVTRYRRGTHDARGARGVMPRGAGRSFQARSVWPCCVVLVSMVSWVSAKIRFRLQTTRVALRPGGRV